MRLISLIAGVLLLMPAPFAANAKVTSQNKTEVRQLIESEPWARDVFDKLQQRTDGYVDRGDDWLSSRLQMYWNTHATDVFIRGEYFDHTGGEKAPAPTVMHSGARSHATQYARPRLDELTPYQEDPRGLYLANNSLEGKPKEWVNPSKTGNIIQSINQEIAGLGRDAAFMYWMTGDEKYARAAAKVFDTYMTGIYYRNVPKDLNHGHQQTLVGMASYEVIHEDIVLSLVELYDFLRDYLKAEYPDKIAVYDAAFKKWADNIIDNGVPHNNWDMIQARFIMAIALALQDDRDYADGRGREYYTDKVFKDSSIRQWSLDRLADYGFDKETGIWAECPGYSLNVVRDYVDFTGLSDANLGKDLTERLPVIGKAVTAAPQYLFPNRNIAGFGDTHPSPLKPEIFEGMIRNAQAHGKKADERHYTRMLRLFNPGYKPAGQGGKPRVAVSTFFGSKPLEIDTTIAAGTIDEYVTPTFHVPSVSWFVQRSGMDPRHSLMASLNASEGNHMHANGISLELYGKGLVLGPDAGIGKTLYSGQDYLEYYSQFPAHNTVCVDGISAYPVMKSNHAFDLVACYPAPGARVGYQPVSYSDLSFIEPESYADQDRLTSIVTVDSVSGYYVDIFRSRKIRGGDKTHDYFYHNLGQDMTLTRADGSPLDLQPTEELAFAGAHLYAYSYIYDKKSARTADNILATFNVRTPDRDDITMRMWMKGAPDRKVFQALSPMTEGLSRLPGMPYKIADQPTLTFVARQEGEAWNRPFVAVFQPSSVKEPGTITAIDYPEMQGSDAAIRVTHDGGAMTDRIISSDNDKVCGFDKFTTDARYALWRTDKDGASLIIFMGDGTTLNTPAGTVSARTKANVLLRRLADGTWQYTASVPCTVTLGKRKHTLRPASAFTAL